ncbi:nuclear transport factor 2 family protein [Psychroserpens luteolus]|uniref:nuclear transport factor 2 family protein n=1 Tax=Psychroserpens luteolus TaxID=2855840 RepID=UPI001E327034|nr:nuclear transport factor 2 family protein [Psychroserpens luteolus]MCD2260009.1 nuclear transport factor 2 family protein [Psychroserpens luteolus]
MKKTSLLLVIFLLVSVSAVNAQSIDNLKEINLVWGKFYKAFETLDYKLMAEIHSKELVRISGGNRIIDYETYINNYKSGFKRDANNGDTSTISLRFFERINNESQASERGVYKLIRNKNKPNEQAYYGQFHVIFAKENGVWKITMDYDSNESNTIDEKAYQKAHAIDDFEKFLKE